jgi:hypothetical protein
MSVWVCNDTGYGSGVAASASMGVGLVYLPAGGGNVGTRADTLGLWVKVVALVEVLHLWVMSALVTSAVGVIHTRAHQRRCMLTLPARCDM